MSGCRLHELVLCDLYNIYFFNYGQIILYQISVINFLLFIYVGGRRRSRYLATARINNEIIYLQLFSPGNLIELNTGQLCDSRFSEDETNMIHVQYTRYNRSRDVTVSAQIGCMNAWIILYVDTNKRTNDGFNSITAPSK